MAWLWLMAGLWCALLAWLRSADPFGDRGMTNVLTGLWLALSALAGLAIFLTRRRLRPGVRLGVLAALAAAAVLLGATVRVRGVSGEMVPRLVWRGAERAEPAPARSGAIELAAPGPDDFPGFLGPRRDNAVPGARLAPSWDAEQPRLRWRGPIGAGWAAFAVAGGWAFTQEQDATGERASARALADGSVGWSVVIDEPFEHVLGGPGPRATPSVVPAETGAWVVAQSAHGRLVCLDARDGSLRWQHDLVAEHGLTRALEKERAQYGRSSSPLVAGELVIVPAGGDGAHGGAGLVAYELASGLRRWASPARHYSYSSPARATLLGRQQVLCVNEASLAGHALDDGRLLWEHPWPGRTSGDANVSQPVPLEPAHVFISKGYGGGGLLLALEPRADGGLGTRQVWHEPRLLRTKFTNVVRLAQHLYGLDDGMLECVELESGAKRWKEGRYGHGQILLAGELLLVCSEEGEVALLAPSPARPNDVLGRFQALAGKSWAHLALAGNVLLLRNAEECAAWELPAAR